MLIYLVAVAGAAAWHGERITKNQVATVRTAMVDIAPYAPLGIAKILEDARPVFVD